MTSFVKHVFTFLLWVSIAWITYLVLFGTYSLEGKSLVGTDSAYTGNTTQSVAWEGVLWHMARSVENPISKYYYEFCFVPNIHASDYVDSALGGSINGTVFNAGNIYATETDLSGGSDMYTFSAGYSTGWK